MKDKNIIIGIIYVICMLFCYFGINWMCSYFLDKWIDILIGFPLSLFSIYKVAMSFNNNLKK